MHHSSKYCSCSKNLFILSAMESGLIRHFNSCLLVGFEIAQTSQKKSTTLVLKVPMMSWWQYEVWMLFWRPDKRFCLHSFKFTCSFNFFVHCRYQKVMSPCSSFFKSFLFDPILMSCFLILPELWRSRRRSPALCWILVHVALQKLQFSGC